MGRTVAVARLVALAALIGVAGCGSPARHADTNGPGSVTSPAAAASAGASASPSAPVGPGEPYATLRHPADFDGGVGYEEGIAFLPSGTVVGSDEAGIIDEWNPATGKIISTIAPPGSHAHPAEDAAGQLVLSRSATTLAAVGSQEFAPVAWLFDVRTGKLNATLPSRTGNVASVAFSPDGDTLAVATQDDSARDQFSLWDVTSHKLVRTVADPRDNLNWITWSPSGTTIAVADGPGAALFNAATGHMTAALDDPAPPPDQPGAGPIAKRALSVAFNPSGTLLAVADGHGDVYLWDVATATPRLERTLTAPGQGGTTTANTVAFSPSGAMLATDGGPGAYLWDLASGHVAAVLKDPDPGLLGVLALAFSPDGTTLGAADAGGSIRLWHTGS